MPNVSTLDNSFREQAQMKAAAIKPQNQIQITGIELPQLASFLLSLSEFSSFPITLLRKFLIYFNHFSS